MALAGFPARERRARAADLLERVGLGDRLKHRPDRLSGGEQQRVAIAVGMANRPAMLLADEPTGEVDSHSAEQIFHSLRALNAEFGVTIIIVTHDMTVATRVDRVVGMRDGRTSTEILRRREGDVAISRRRIRDPGSRRALAASRSLYRYAGHGRSRAPAPERRSRRGLARTRTASPGTTRPTLRRRPALSRSPADTEND